MPRQQSTARMIVSAATVAINQKRSFGALLGSQRMKITKRHNRATYYQMTEPNRDQFGDTRPQILGISSKSRPKSGNLSSARMIWIIAQSVA
jgi:hypothetical protein